MKLEKLLQGGPAPAITALPWAERQRLFVFDSRRENGTRYAIQKLDRVTIKPARCLASCLVPKRTICSEIAPLDLLIGWGGHVENHQQIVKMIGGNPFHDMDCASLRSARWPGDVQIFNRRQPRCANVHLCLPIGSMVSAAVAQPGQLMRLDGFSVQVMILDDGRSGFNSLSAARSWGGQDCPSFWPAAFDLAAYADDVVEIEETVAREILAEAA